MDVQKFQKGMLDVFYKRTNYDKINVIIVLCDDIYEYSLAHSPCEEHRQMLIGAKDIVSKLNGISFPKNVLHNEYYAIISKNVFGYKDNTFLGTYMHEITHAHDFSIFAKYINAKTEKDIYNSKYYNCAMGTISEFNARKNGFSFVREQTYDYINSDEERDKILLQEIPYVIDNSRVEKNFDSLSQLFGRMAVFDSKTEGEARYIFYNFLSKVFIKNDFDNIVNIYEMLYKYKDEKNSLALCLPQIYKIMNNMIN